jgi:site-specific DNA-methyltransferase (adenine-specific)
MSEQASFTLRNRNPDVLTCIANLSNDEVFTPPELANQMLDSLTQAWAEDNDGANLWEDKNVKFLDPCAKSGVFLREITARLTSGLEKEIPDLEKRVEHILSKQVYGIGITKLTSLLARRSVYCSKNADGVHSIAKSLKSKNGNIWYENLSHTWVAERCKFCGASRKVWDRGNDFDSHAYAFIHARVVKSLIDKIFGVNMQFDVIIGNPPYQLSTGESSDSPIYQLFVKQAIALDPRYLLMVTPSRWFTGGKGLSDYRELMISDRRIRKIVDFPRSMETFPGVEIKGGVSYFLWTKDSEGDCEFTTVLGDEIQSKAIRDLRVGKGVVIRDNLSSKIIDKVLHSHKGSFLSSRVSPQTPFGMYTNFTDWHTKKREGDVQLFKRGLDEAWTNRKNILSRAEWIPMIKVIMSYAYNGGDALPHQIIGRPFIIPGNSAVTQTYMVAGVFDDKDSAENYVEYLKTKFVRFLIRQRKISQHNRPDTFAFVPELPMNVRWTDEILYKEFGISIDEQEYISSIVKLMPMTPGLNEGVDE